MSVKQDRTYARTASDLERKYNYRASFSEVMGLVSDLRQEAEDMSESVAELDEKLDQEEIFNRLTNNGTSKAIYRENGDIYINASFIKTGFISSDMIKAGVIRSTDYEIISLDRLYPSSSLYPDVSLYPNAGEDISKGIEIDFAAGVIRGVLTSTVTKNLEQRIKALEQAVFI